MRAISLVESVGEALGLRVKLDMVAGEAWTISDLGNSASSLGFHATESRSSPKHISRGNLVGELVAKGAQEGHPTWLPDNTGHTSKIGP
jgi:hypothetical protein